MYNLPSFLLRILKKRDAFYKDKEYLTPIIYFGLLFIFDYFGIFMKIHQTHLRLPL
jgi:hypothetical protein